MKVAMMLSIAMAIGTTCWTLFPASEDVVDVKNMEGKTLNANGKEDVYAGDVALLRVSSWDEDKKIPSVFEVSKEKGIWIIPSHHKYPADGGTRVGDTSGAVLNVLRGPLVTKDSETFKDYDLLDPEKGDAASEGGRGKRVILKDKGGAVLVDLIIGKKAETSDVYFVREADSEEVYTAKVNPDISTKFKDWVETDPLKITESDIRDLTILDYSVDEASQSIKMRSQTQFRKPKDAKDWTSVKTPKKKVVNDSAISDLLREVSGLKLEGVRPYNKMWLAPRGFFEQKGGHVVANEGSIYVSTKNGLHYNLAFGEIALGDDQDVSAKVVKKDKAVKKDEAAKKDAKGHNRYMVVFVSYDKATDETIKKAEPKPKDGPPMPIEVSEGRKKYLKEKARFEKFFYVISDESFKKMRPAIDKLFKDAEIKKENLPGEKIGKDIELEKKDGGLHFADLRKGTGDEAATGDKVNVHYTGWLEEGGKKFDSSLDRGKPFPFTLGEGGVIQGWDQGVVGMKVGGKRKLVIPSKLGYAERGSPPTIPPNARLVFDIELLNVTKKKTKAPAVIELPKKGGVEIPKTTAPEGSKGGATKKPEDGSKKVEPKADAAKQPADGSKKAVAPTKEPKATKGAPPEKKPAEGSQK